MTMAMVSSVIDIEKRSPEKLVACSSLIRNLHTAVMLTVSHLTCDSDSNIVSLGQCPLLIQYFPLKVTMFEKFIMAFRNPIQHSF